MGAHWGMVFACLKLGQTLVDPGWEGNGICTPNTQPDPSGSRIGAPWGMAFAHNTQTDPSGPRMGNLGGMAFAHPTPRGTLASLSGPLGGGGGGPSESPAPCPDGSASCGGCQKSIVRDTKEAFYWVRNQTGVARE